MFEQKFAFLIVDFHMRQCHSDFYCFFVFLDRIFSKWFSSAFIVHSRTSFLFEPNFHFWLVVFCSYAAF